MTDTPHPDPEKLWYRRWLSHAATLVILAGYLFAVARYGAPDGPVWALVFLALGFVAPAIAEAFAKLRRP